MQQKAQRESVITLSFGLLMLLLLLWLGGSSAVLAKSHIVCLSLQTQADQGMRVLVCIFFCWQHERLLFCLTTHAPNTYTCGGVPFTWRWVSMYNNGHPLSWTKSRCLEENGPSISNSDLLLSPDVQMQFFICNTRGRELDEEQELPKEIRQKHLHQY